MSEIPCKLARQLLDGGARFGLTAEAIAGAAGQRVDRLQDPRGRVSWDEFIRLHEALEGLGLSADDFVTLGASLPQAGYHPLLAGIARHVFTVRQLYLAAGRWFTPSVFPMMRLTHRDLADGRLEFVFDIPRHYRGSTSFFQINQGVLTVMPTLMGLRPAEVDTEVGSHRAIYKIRPPVRRSLGERARTVIRALASSPSLLGEVARQQEEIASGYRALVRARHDFHKVIESLPDAVLICRSGAPIYVNPAACDALGGLPLFRLTTTGFVLGLVGPDHRSAAAQLFAGRPATEATTYELEFQLADPPRSVWLEFARPRPVEFEGTPALLLVARDITKRKRIEAELARSEQLAGLGRLLANVSHELSNPLTYVDLNLGVLGSLLDGTPDAKALDRARAVVVSARDGSERAQLLLRDLASFSPTIELDRERVDLRRVAEAATALAAVELADHMLIRDYRPVPAVRGAAARLEQVLVNLLRNAAHACSRGGEIRLSLSTDPAGCAVVEVADDGPGIAPDLIARIFDPFFTTKPVGVGTGLGLAICDDIVTRLGGSLSVASTIGQGARFTIRLPAAAETGEATAQSAVASGELPGRPRRRVLVIDDEPSLIEVLREVIGQRHDVVVVNSAEAALDLLEADSRFDVILCDLMMRGLTGMQLYERLEVDYPELVERVTFMTGGAYSEAARRFLQRIANRCLDKPFALDDVLEAVEAGPVVVACAGAGVNSR